MTAKTACPESSIKDLQSETTTEGRAEVLSPLPPLFRRRRRHIKTLARAVLENDRVYFELERGLISKADADIRSRIIGRQGELIARQREDQAREQRAAVRAQQLAELKRIYAHEPARLVEAIEQLDRAAEPEGNGQ